MNIFTKITKNENNIKVIRLMYSIRGVGVPIDPTPPGQFLWIKVLASPGRSIARFSLWFSCYGRI
jgi:hypothetical protein